MILFDQIKKTTDLCGFLILIQFLQIKSNAQVTFNCRFFLNHHHQNDLHPLYALLHQNHLSQ